MSNHGPEFHTIDTGALTTAQWSALMQRGIRQAHIERSRAAQELAQLPVMRFDRSARRQAPTVLPDQVAPATPDHLEAAFALPITVLLSMQVDALRRGTHTQYLGVI